MKVSIVIRALNEERHIGSLLESISRQILPYPYEVILVDSGSSDKTLDIAKGYEVRIAPIPSSGFTYGYSLNYGIKHASGDIICCISAHCIPSHNNWLFELSKPLIEGKAQATYGRQIPIKGINPFEEVFLDRNFPEAGKRNGRVPFSNANCAFVRRVWEEVKFDEQIPSWEDYLWYLLTKDKFVFRYVPDACVVHTHPFEIRRLRKTAFRDGKAFKYMKSRYNIDILGETGSLTGKVHFASKDILNHTRFFLKERYLYHLVMLPFVKLYSYLTYWRGYHSSLVVTPESERPPVTVKRERAVAGHPPTVSFIIPNWNHRQLLHECISSIYDTVGDLSHEIIVVDNASTDDSAGYILESFPEVRWIQNHENLGYAKAVNQGVASSGGGFLFLLNNDVKLMGGVSERLISFLAGHPEVGAVAPLLYYPDGRLQISCRRFPSPAAIFLEKLHVRKIGHYMRLKLTPEEHLSGGQVLQPMASALMVRRECWDEVGPMDEGFPIFFNDVDWCYRLYRNTGYTIHINPEARAIHHEGASIKRLGHKKKIKLYRGLARFYYKHFLSFL